MSLLQIHDPSGKPRPIGIDLGTTHSLVAYVSSLGEPIPISDCDGAILVPSVVHYASDGRVVVGDRARALALDFPRDTISSAKRWMGRSASELDRAARGPYRFVREEEAVCRVEVAGGRAVSPVEVSAEILRELRERAEDELGRIGGAVITVPAYFDDAQRQATRDAARIAGLEVLRMISEPTAAALAYGLEAKANGTFAVYDLGGGTFDVTILVLEEGVFQVKATGGDSQLGGDDMDHVLSSRILGEFGWSETHDPARLRFALDAGRALKHALTDHAEVEVTLQHEGLTRLLRTTRDEFDQGIEPLLARTGLACRRALRDAGVEPAQLDGVILVGGATRVPAVRAFVERTFGLAPLSGVDPDLVVALGAALQADALAGGANDVLLLDVLPLSLGVEAMGGVVEKVLPRNSPIPSEAAQVFTTYADGQTGFELHVVQGERELAADCRSLARFTLRGIPKMAAGLPRLEVRFAVDADGILTVSAREQVTGVAQRVEVKPSHGLTDADIERMLEEAYDAGEDDLAKRALAEARVEAERVLFAVEKALAEDADLVGSSERAEIDQAVATLRRVSREATPGGHRRLVAAREALEDATHAFAGRRMDRAIGAALAGREVQHVEAETAHAKGIERAHEPQA